MSKPKPNLELVQQALTAWLKAFLELVRCMGPSGATLILVLHEGFKQGLTIMDLIVRILGSNFQLPLALRR